jgi:hypothetical protein
VLSSSAMTLLFPHPFRWKYFTMNLCSNLFMTAPRFETLFRFEIQHWMEKTLVNNRIIEKRRDICAMRRANDSAWRGVNHSIVWHDIHISRFSSNKANSIIFISLNTIVLWQILIRIQQT